MHTCFRIGAICSAVFAAISAQAVTFAFQTEGTYTEPTNTITVAGNTATYRSGHSAGLLVSAVNYSFIESMPGVGGFPSQILAGGGTVTGTYQLVPYVLTFIVGDGGIFRGNNTTLNRSFAAGATYSIVGSALNGEHGEGVLGGTYIGDTNLFAGLSKTSFDFSPAAVPEPTSMAVFSIGLLGFVALRRRN